MSAYYCSVQTMQQFYRRALGIPACKCECCCCTRLLVQPHVPDFYNSQRSTPYEIEATALPIGDQPVCSERDESGDI